MRFDSLAVDSFFTVHILFDIYGLLPCVVFENGFFCLLLYDRDEGVDQLN